MNTNVTPQVDPQEKEKENKRLYESYVTVLKHKLGRDPEMAEIQDAMSKDLKKDSSLPTAQSVQSPVGAEGADKSEMQDTDMPNILKVKVYYGMSDGEEGESQPDPHKILFYENPDGKCYDCNHGEWMQQRPPILDHLNSRLVSDHEKDILSVIAHGVMDDNDYSSLEKRGLVPDSGKAIWGLKKKLQRDTEQLKILEKSENVPPEETEGQDNDYDDADDYQVSIESGVNQELSNPPIDITEGEMEIIEQVGEDVFIKIMQIAQAKALTGMEDQIRAIVHDEIENISNSMDTDDVYEEDVSEEIPENNLESEGLNETNEIE